MSSSAVTGATASPAPKLLHLGCGLMAPPEWVNVDGSSNAWLAQHPTLKAIIKALHLMPRSQLEVPWPRNIVVANLAKRLPFPDGNFDAVFSSHLLEHLYREQAVKLLHEARRVLKPGGICRSLVPDLESLIKEYLGQTQVAGMEGLPVDDPARRFVIRLLMRSEAPHGGRFIYRMLQSRSDLHSHKWMYDGVSLLKLMSEAGFVNCRVRGFRESEIPHIDKVENPGRVLEGAGVIVEGVKPS